MANVYCREISPSHDYRTIILLDCSKAEVRILKQLLDNCEAVSEEQERLKRNIMREIGESLAYISELEEIADMNKES